MKSFLEFYLVDYSLNFAEAEEDGHIFSELETKECMTYEVFFST